MLSTRWMQNLSKVDFVTSVGLYILRDRIVLVRLRKNLRRVSLLEQEARELPESDDRQGISGLTGWIAEDVREIALKTEHDSRERGLRQALLSLMQYCNVVRDSFFICVPQDQAMVQKIFLPRAAEANLQEVLQYEIERYLPFRREDVYYDYMAAGKEGEKIGVFLFAIPKKSLSNLLEILASFGIKPKGIETTATAVANYLLFCAEETSELATIIGGQNHSLEVVGVQNKTNGWKSVPELTYSYWLREMDWRQSPGKDLLQQCFSQSARLYGWGEVEEVFRSSDGVPVQYEDLVERGKQRFKGGGKIANPLVLPAFGAALRGVREDSFAGNVLSADVRDAQRRGVLSYVNAALIGLVILAVLAWGATYPIKDELRLRQLQKENQKLEPAVEALRREEDELQRARKEGNFFSQFDQKRGEVLRVLDELSKIVPTNAYLSNLRYKAGALEMQGSAENASTLIPLLERSPVFENVGFNAPSNRGRDNRETFSLKADVERPKEKTEKATKP
ncbi:MAG TPA: PilN domain-containing protein [Candidatus Acidoferrales bacterium]|nr:PilN domain-containing protein [Candidatus Acidoferrales bacterium]